MSWDCLCCRAKDYIHPCTRKCTWRSWTHLCRCHIRLHSRPHPCRTRRIIPVRTSLRASRTPCGSSAPLCRPHRPGNSRSHPRRCVHTAASRRTAPRCICPGSSPRTWYWVPTLQHRAQEVRTRQWGGEKTSLSAAGELAWSLFWWDGEEKTTSGRLEWSNRRLIRLQGYQQWTTLFCTWLAPRQFPHSDVGVPFFGQSGPF